jgi:hypothetical protein
MEAASPDHKNMAIAIVFVIGNIAYSPPVCPETFFRANGNALKKISISNKNNSERT